MIYRKIFLAAIALLVCQASAKAHNQGTLSSLNVGIRYSSILQNRGVVLYRDFQVDPVVGVFLFDDKLEFLGDSIGYRDFVYGDSVRLRGRFVSITDKPLFPDHQSVREPSPDRKDTYEFNARAEIFLPGYREDYLAEVDLGVSKDLSMHHGHYFDIQSKVKLFNFRAPIAATLIEPNLVLSVGWGDSAHNKYFYGPSARESGFNNWSYGIWLALPEEADRYYPIVQLTRFETLGQANRVGEFARARDEGWLFSFIATLGLLD